METMFPPGFHHNGFVATHALGHIMEIKPYMKPYMKHKAVLGHDAHETVLGHMKPYIMCPSA